MRVVLAKHAVFVFEGEVFDIRILYSVDLQHSQATAGWNALQWFGDSRWCGVMCGVEGIRVQPLPDQSRLPE